MNNKKGNITRPPRLAEMLLKLFLRNGLMNQRLGEYQEVFEFINDQEGIYKARLWYWKHTLKSMPNLIYNSFYWGVIMLISYFKIAFRNLLKNKGYSSINIFGLAVGIACCLLTLFWVQDEFSYDAFHENKSQIFRVVQKWNNDSGEMGQEWIPGTVAPLLPASYPEVQHAARVVFRQRQQIAAEDKSFINSCLIADPNFFSIFTFPFVFGNKHSALQNPNSIVISKSMSEKVFGYGNPLGKTLIFDNDHVLTITGVYSDVPVNSHLQFDFCIPYSLLPASYPQWGNNDHITYVQLAQGSDYKAVTSKISNVLKDNKERCESVLALQPLSEIHLYSLAGADRITYIYIFSAMAIIVLLIACINFMNLSTAKAVRRAKEVGIRKVIGSKKGQLIIQFLSESIVLAFIAAGAGLFLALLSLPFVNEIVGHEIKVDPSPLIVAYIIIITLLTGLLAGSYPAFFLSSFNPIYVIKKMHGRAGNTGAALFRKTLTVIQFSVSIFFIIAAISIYKQMIFTSNKDMGIDKENIILMDMHSGLKEKYETVKEALLKQPGINSVTSIDIPPLIAWNNTTDLVEWEGMDQENRLSFSVKTIDYDFLKTFDADMAEGRFFSKKNITDVAEGYVINEAAVKAMNLKSPVGKGISLWEVQGRIIGIVKDFHVTSLKSKISPLILRIRTNKANYVCVRIMPGVKKTDAVDLIESTFNEIIPVYPFHYSFLSDEYRSLYTDESLTSKITLYITLLMIVISCLGLLGLASFMAEQKKKEIGMRKVLGASVQQIVVLLSNDFVKRILIANIIAWPVAFYIIDKWLMNFAYRIELELDIFIYAGLTSVILAIATVSYQTIKAAAANPVESIKSE